MKVYTFTAEVTVLVTGSVSANSEEEAIEKISNGDVDDIVDSDFNNDYHNIDIVCEEKYLEEDEPSNM